MPDPGFKIQYFLVDLPYADAFASPGGRVYFSQKVVALARSEDEVAGILAHELGHVITHQGAREVSRQLTTVLGVSKIGDRQDVFNRMNELFENWRRHAEAMRRGRNLGQEQQEVADQIAVYALAAAGYSPQAFPDVFDRLAGTAGKTGNWLTDLFGLTNPTAKRLREMLQTSSSISSGCTDRYSPDPLEFQSWRERVIAFDGWKQRELLHDVTAKVKLDPPMPSELDRVKFSPDGHYLLGSDLGTIYVFRRDWAQLQRLFTIPAAGPEHAHFTADSKSIVFVDRNLRIEKWDVAGMRRVEAYETATPEPCYLNELSPDGKTLACRLFGRGLSLIDVATGSMIYSDKSPTGLDTLSHRRQYTGSLSGLRSVFTSMQFTPDGKYFLAADENAEGHTTIFLFDVHSRAPVAPPASLKKRLGSRFAFLGPDRLLTVHGGIFLRHHGDKLNPLLPMVVSFPSGEILKGNILMSSGNFQASTDAKSLIIHTHPTVTYSLGPPHSAVPTVTGKAMTLIHDIASGKEWSLGEARAADVFGEFAASQAPNGEAALYDLVSRLAVTGAELHGGYLGLSRTFVSPDLRYLALSQGKLGGIWDLSSGKRLLALHAFSGAYLEPGGRAYVDFSGDRDAGTERTVAVVSISNHTANLAWKPEANATTLTNRFMVGTVRDKQKESILNSLRKDWDLQSSLARSTGTLTVRDVRTGKTLWSRAFPKGLPRVFASGHPTMIWLWSAGDEGGVEELKDLSQLQGRLASDPADRKGQVLMEVIETETGKMLNALLMDTGRGSFWISRAYAEGKWLVASDNLGRVLLYNLQTGEQVGRLFGSEPIISTTAKLLAVEKGSGNLYIYDLDSLDEVDHYVFSSPILMSRFTDDGRKLWAFTADQTAYTLDSPGHPEKADDSRPTSMAKPSGH
jgi:WD40 repeat protein